MSINLAFNAAESCNWVTSTPWDLTIRVPMESTSNTGTEALLSKISEMNDSMRSFIAVRNSVNLTLSE